MLILIIYHFFLIHQYLFDIIIYRTLFFHILLFLSHYYLLHVIQYIIKNMIFCLYTVLFGVFAISYYFLCYLVRRQVARFLVVVLKYYYFQLIIISYILIVLDMIYNAIHYKVCLYSIYFQILNNFMLLFIIWYYLQHIIIFHMLLFLANNSRNIVFRYLYIINSCMLLFFNINKSYMLLLIIYNLNNL